MRRVLLAFTLATLLVAAVPSTALMATQTREMCGANDGQAIVSYTFDDVSLLITSFIFKNTGAAGTITITVQDPTTHTNLFGTPRSAAENTGTQTFDARAANLHMVQQTGKGGTTGLAFPFDVFCGWSSV